MFKAKKNNNYKKIILTLLILVFFSGVLLVNSVKAGETADDSCPAGEITLQVPVPGLGHCVKGFPEYIKAFYNFFMSIVGILAVIMIMLGGLQWIMAAGNAQKIAGAKTIIISAIMGLVLTFTSYTILNVLNPDVLTLKLNVSSIDLAEPVGNEVCKLSDNPLDGGQLVKDNATYDTPICGRKYLYAKKDANNTTTTAYCYGFTCGDHMNGRTSLCLKLDNDFSCQNSIHIVDADNMGWGERDWETNEAEVNVDHECGFLYWGYVNGTEIFMVGTKCGSDDVGYLDKDEYCQIDASAGAKFEMSSIDAKKDKKVKLVGKLKSFNTGCDKHGWNVKSK